MIKVGQVYSPKDKRRDNRRIRVKEVRVYGLKPNHVFMVIVESRLVGQRTWKPAPAIRLDRLESRHYKLLKDA